MKNNNTQYQLAIEVLKKLGYSSEAGLQDGAKRIIRVPELFSDMLEYAKTQDSKEQSGAHLLSRTLQDGHTVASLMSNYQFEVTGAFLMAVELQTNPDTARKILNRMIEEGFWRELPDGRRIKVELPAAKDLPYCPGCALRFTRSVKSCPRCGYGSFEKAIDEGRIPDEIIKKYEKNSLNKSSYWYYLLEGKQKGPIPENELRELIKTNKISLDTFVWSEGMNNWEKASSMWQLQ